MTDDLKPGDPVHVEFDGTYGFHSDTTPCVDIGLRSYLVPLSAVTKIEPPRPEWADRFGTVLLDRNGSAWQRGNYNWHRPPSVSCIYEVLLDTYGPLTLLYDPATDK